MTLTPRTGRRPTRDLQGLKEKVLQLREKGFGPVLIAKKLKTNKSWVDRIIYPSVAEKQRKTMLERYFKMKAKNLCHQCGQKLPKPPLSN